MKPGLDYLKELAELGRIARGERNPLNTTRLEEEFLAFSSCMPSGELSVRLPKLYMLGGTEKEHFVEVLKALNDERTKIPESVGISGCFEHRAGQDTLIFFSPNQLSADPFSSSVSYLLPLIERIYSDGATLIRDFAIHEALFGQVSCKRGELDLRELHLFPEKFEPGPYQLAIELDTPTKTVREFREVQGLLSSFESAPNSLLDPEKVKETTTRALELRKRVGSLSRYEARAQTFSVETNSCVLRNRASTSFYLYSPTHGQNVLVYFGACPIQEASQLARLLVLDGNKQQHTLSKLVELDIFKPSLPVLEQRITDLTELWGAAIRAADTSLNGKHANFRELLERLKTAGAYFREVIN